MTDEPNYKLYDDKPEPTTNDARAIIGDFMKEALAVGGRRNPHIDIAERLCRDFAATELDQQAIHYERLAMSLTTALEWIEDPSTEAAIVMRTMSRCNREMAMALKRRAVELRSQNTGASGMLVIPDVLEFPQEKPSNDGHREAL